MQKSDVLLLELWNKIREKLSLELGNGNYAELFENVNEINEFSNNNAYFITKSSFQATRFSHYLNRINELSKSFSPDEIIRFNFMTQEQFNREKSLFKKENKEASISSNINPLYTYSRLIIGAFNVTTYSSSTKIADRPTGEINPLYIFGDTGLGKTHFMHAIGNYILSQNPKYKILYIKANDFRENYVHHSLNKNLEDFKNVYKDIDILLVDDIQMIAGSTKTQEEFFVIFEKLSNLNKQIVITSDRSPLKLKDMADRLVSRFSKGVQVEITHPEYPDRIKIITEKVQ
jgi:chromosomal replication initiator protein